ncbi:MAG: dephospho-CoA kinase [Clostridia bacterium]|nr:dephospho-CoA kinase [Clostridia bacterium]
MKNIIGLTGPTGSGKSSLKEVAENFGAAFIDCDTVVHSIFETDADCIRAIKAAFGEDTVENGRVNRKALALKAFASEDGTALLNETVFPFVTYAILKEISAKKEQIVILDAPTLYESGIDEICCVTIAVLADKQTRTRRIISRDNLSDEAAALRLSAGKDDEFYLNKAQKIIYNNEDIKTLQKDFEIFLEDFKGGNLK